MLTGVPRSKIFVVNGIEYDWYYLLADDVSAVGLFCADYPFAWR